MLNTFHVRRSKEVECQKGATDSTLPLARPAGTTTGGETRVRKLCYRSVNASEKVQLPPASDVRHGNSTWLELDVDPFLRRFRPTLSNVFRIVNKCYLLARVMLLFDVHPTGFNGYSKIALTTLHRKKRNITI